MTDVPPPLPPFNDDGYMTAEPCIAFTIDRIVVARRNEIYRAWTDLEQFKRWVVSPDQKLVSCHFESKNRIVWNTKDHAGNGSIIEHVLETQTAHPYKLLEIQYYTTAVPGMMDEHPVYLYLELDKRQWDGTANSTDYKLTLRYHSAMLWRHTRQIDLHNFWLEATERLTRLVEESSILNDTATPALPLQIS